MGDHRRRAGKGVLRKPTKRNDWRDVPLTAGAVAAIRRQHERAVELRGVPPFPTDYVFPSPLDPAAPYRPDTFGDRWALVSGSSDVTMLHLRHFAATTMLDAGEDYRTVAEILGNSENTLKLHYDGRTGIGKRRAIERVGAVEAGQCGGRFSRVIRRAWRPRRLIAVVLGDFEAVSVRSFARSGLAAT